MSDTLVFNICNGSFLFLTFVSIMVFRWSEGLWSNFILSMNLSIAAVVMFPLKIASMSLGMMLASSFGWEPMSSLWLNIPVAWCIFAVIIGILEMITKQFSHVQVKFNKHFELVFNFLVLFFGVYGTMVLLSRMLAAEAYAVVFDKLGVM